jgi:hypothetical protein
MVASPQYDDETMKTLVEYFRHSLCRRNGEAANGESAADGGRGDFLYAAGVRQQHRLRLKLPVRAARADDGFNFPENHEMWRAINSPAMHTLFYLSIIAWETATMVLCWWGAAKLGRALHGTARRLIPRKNGRLPG